MPGILGVVKLDATVRRTKQNYRTICLAKLNELPPTLGDWMNLPNENFGDRTPNEVIEADEGHLVEVRIEKLQHLHESFTALAKIFERYRDVPELEETWQIFLNAWPKYQAIIGEPTTAS